MIKNRLVKEDKEFFERMRGHYRSDNERMFFEKLRHKQENVLTCANDLILSEKNNEDGLYIVRCEFEEYVVGQEHVTEESHYMCLADALEANLKEIGLLNRDITLWQWLRERDYAGVEYDHNYDDM